MVAVVVDAVVVHAFFHSRFWCGCYTGFDVVDAVVVHVVVTQVLMWLLHRH